MDPILDYYTPTRAVLPRAPISWPERIAYIALGILLPIVCFGFTLALGPRPPLGPEWQSGRWFDLAAMMLSGHVAWPFFPFLLYPMVSLGWLVVRPRQAAQRFLVRMGLYSGIVLAMQFAVIEAIALATPPAPLSWGTSGAVIAALVASAALCAAGLAFDRWLWPPLVRHLQGRRGLIAIWIAVAVALSIPSAGAIIGIVLIGAPCWTMGIYLLASIRLGQLSERKPNHWLWLLSLGWAGAYGAAWRTSVHLAISEYAKLPTQPPSCYIATAAAHGHRRWVGARDILLDDKTCIRVNHQLRRLKAAEIALRTVWPAGHRCVRRVYDLLGSALARRIARPWLADAAYLLLKPAEGLAAMALWCISRDAGQWVKSLYHEPGEGS